MTNPLESIRRARWLSQGRIDPCTTPEPNLEQQLIQEHLSQGWLQETTTADVLCFSIYTKTGRKWTKEYDRNTCLFVCERFFSVDHLARAAIDKVETIGWPNVDFGD